MTLVPNEQSWLEEIRAQLLRGDIGYAQRILTPALAEHPTSVELCRLQAGIFQQSGNVTEAEAWFRQLLARDPGDSASAFPLARLLKAQGRTAELASILRTCVACESNCGDADLAIAAIELLDDCDRKPDAAAVAQAAIEKNPDDPRLHAYAGMLEIQLGEFERARKHYRFALQHDARAWEWHVPIGLSSAQRYTNRDHPDFELFGDGLRRDGLSDRARAELHFASGKARDDLGEYAEAARHFRDGNAIAHRLTRWSRKPWRRTVEAQLAAPRHEYRVEASADDFVPVFIVGMPRSGTTLLAELLSRHPKVCNRGELPWIAQLAQQPDLAGDPDHDAIARAAATYERRSRQDDAADARWFLDKQPLNFRYIGLMLAMFPRARIVHCTRSLRDTALSLWMQCFREEVQGYAYDFDDIALVMRDEKRLMSHWQALHARSILSVRYEDIVSKTHDTIGRLADWIGLPVHEAIEEGSSTGHAGAISTASLWQARQPVSTGSVGRWRHYAPYVPELMRFAD